MRLITNPGSNVSKAMVARYDVDLTAQQIIVDDKRFDTRESISHATIDGWVRTAKQHPHVLGTSAAESVEIFKQASRFDDELIAIMTSRKLIGSYTAAIAAKKALALAPATKHLRIAVIDTRTTDLGANLCLAMAGEAIRAGLPFDDVVSLVERFAAREVLGLAVGTLDYLVKGGRAGFLRAWLANLLDVSPILTFNDGELKAEGRISRSKSIPVAIAELVTAKLGRGRRVWAGVSYSTAPELAAELEQELRSRLDIAYLETRRISSSIYLHTGPGALGAFVNPIDDLGFDPPAPRF